MADGAAPAPRSGGVERLDEAVVRQTIALARSEGVAVVVLNDFTTHLSVRFHLHERVHPTGAAPVRRRDEGWWRRGPVPPAAPKPRDDTVAPLAVPKPRDDAVAPQGGGRDEGQRVPRGPNSRARRSMRRSAAHKQELLAKEVERLKMEVSQWQEKEVK